MKLLTIVKHLGAWGLVFLFVNSGGFEWSGFSSERDNLFGATLYGSVFNALLFYLHALYLFPRFIKVKWSYVLLMIAVVVAFSLVEALADLQYVKHLGEFEQFLMYFGIDDSDLTPGEQAFTLVVAFLYGNVIVHVLVWVVSFSYLIPLSIRRAARLEKDKLQAELRFLKAQIEPHTLFNGINSIYHLMDEDVEQAKSYLLGFSNLLRYQIYECQEEQIPVQKEMDFLEDVLRLGKLKVGEMGLVQWEFDLNQMEQRQVAPLLLYPFIENAFKYLSDYDNPTENQLMVKVSLHQHVLNFFVRNTYDVSLKENQPTKGGLGLQNVRERLSLIYPKKHILNVIDECGQYSVQLKVWLDA